jgi:predicted oxidoreductase
MPYDPESEINVAVRRSFENSLRNLHRGEQWIWEENEKGKSTTESKRRRPWIDSYLLHSPLNTLEETLQAWNTMEDLVLEGKVRQIGFSSEYSVSVPFISPLSFLD